MCHANRTNRLSSALIFMSLILWGLSPAAQDRPRSPSDPDDPPDREVAQTAGTHKNVKRIELSNIFFKPQFWQTAAAKLPAMLDNSFDQGMLKTEFVYYPSGKRQAVTFLGQTVHESVIRLDGGHPGNLYAVLAYTKQEGSLGEVKKSFSDAESELNKKLHSKGKRNSFTFSNKRVIKITEWNNPSMRVQLRSSEEAPGAFVSVCLENPSKPNLEMEQRLSVKKEYFNLAASKAVSNGKNYKVLAVPMRKQLADIGSCWSTTLARQLAYMGSETETQIVETMVDGDGESKTFDGESSKFGFHRLTYSIQSRNQASESCIQLLKLYNSAAEKNNSPQIKFTEENGNISFGDNFMNMKTALLPPVSNDQKERCKLFRDIIISSVKQNLPVGWVVVRWAPVNCRGGGKHRRMIIGYDLDKDLIHFSDSWGFHCEDRTMPFRAAFAMTVWMQTLAPNWIPNSDFPQPDSK
jgi:hypothetical protein